MNRNSHYIINRLLKPLDKLELVCHKYIKWWKQRRLIARNYIFDNRSHNSENLLLIVAGFQEFYWDTVFGRVSKNCKQFEESMDVCVCVPCGENKGGEDVLNNIRKRCEEKGWSLVYLYDDLLAQAQNTAIMLHPHAKWIYKIDEDIILSDYYFSKLKRGYSLAERCLFAQIGFVTPLINLNAACFPYFLETIGKKNEMRELFGDVHIRYPKEVGDPVHRSCDFARWIWEQSTPFDTISKKVEDYNKGKIFQANIRLSIGAILFTREYWQSIGYFDVAYIGAMGVEEVQMNSFSFNNMQAIAIVGDTFAGHLGFGSQKQECKDFYEKNKHLF